MKQRLLQADWYIENLQRKQQASACQRLFVASRLMSKNILWLAGFSTLWYLRNSKHFQSQSLCLTHQRTQVWSQHLYLSPFFFLPGPVTHSKRNSWFRSECFLHFEEACLFLRCCLGQLYSQVWLERVSCRGKFPKKWKCCALISVQDLPEICSPKIPLVSSFNKKRRHFVSKFSDQMVSN